MPVETVNSDSDLEALRSRIVAATASIRSTLHEVRSLDPIEAMACLKFDEVGRHPLEDRPLNFIEQVNQTFTYLASLAAAEEVAQRHPGAWPIELRLGTTSGPDVVSRSASVAAEAFAAVHPNNNDKLRRDIAKARQAAARHKYVFYFCRGWTSPAALVGGDVTVIALSENQVLGPFRGPPGTPL